MQCYQEAFDANVAKKQIQIMRHSGATTIALCVRDHKSPPSADPSLMTVKLVAAATFSIFGFSRANHKRHYSTSAPPHINPVVELIAVGVRQSLQTRGLGAIIVNGVRCLVTHMLGTSTRIVTNHHMSTQRFWQHQVCAMIPSKRSLYKELKPDSQERWEALLTSVGAVVHWYIPIWCQTGTGLVQDRVLHQSGAGLVLVPV